MHRQLSKAVRDDIEIPHFVPHFVAHFVVYASSHALSNLRPRRFEHGPAFRSMKNPPTNPEAPSRKSLGIKALRPRSNFCAGPKLGRANASKSPKDT
jgi:hypothetical protein